MVTLYIDNAPYSIEPDQNLLQACLSLGFNIPYFCWHPAFGSVGACRQCAVKRFRDEKDTRGEIVMACMTPAADGTRISIDDPEAVQFRAAVIEWLMINHPHDCPVCDEGGECHLQDMTVMTGHSLREYRFKKRTHRNQDLGPFIHHEMNRCIQCYRCVRFYCNIAGGRDFNVFSSRDRVYFGRFAEGALDNEFSGNLVEICPTGVFTDKTQKAHNSRSWDLQTAPSVCVHCGLGCNIFPGARYGRIRRIRNRYHHAVNGYFLCDRGRFGYAFVNSAQRFRNPLGRTNRDVPLAPRHETDLLRQAGSLLRDRQRVIGIGSPRATLEANFALRTLVGPERFHSGVSDVDYRLTVLGCNILSQGPARAATLREAGLADAVLVLGEDVTQTAPLLALALRQLRYHQAAAVAHQFQLPKWDDAAVREFIHQEMPPLFIAASHPTRLDDAARRVFRAAPNDLVRLGIAVRSALDPDAPVVSALPEEMRALAAEIAAALMVAERPLVVMGTACGSAAVIQSAANVAWALCAKGRSASIAFCAPECNSLGLSLMDGRDLQSAMASMAMGRVDTVLILENDLYRRAPASQVDAFLDAAQHVIVVDHLPSPTAAKAHMLFPATTFAEESGTRVSTEGRAQRSYAVIPPEEPVRESRHWLREISTAAGFAAAEFHLRLNDIADDLARDLPVFEQLSELSSQASLPESGNRIPRQSFGYSGRTAIGAAASVHEPKPPEDPDSPLAYSMEGYDGLPPSGLIARYWSPGWNSVQALNKFQTAVGGPLRGGETGVRLITPAAVMTPPYLTVVPEELEPADGEWTAVPIYHLFGSEALSMAAPGIVRSAPEPCLTLNGESMPGLAEGEMVDVWVADQRLTLPLKRIPGMPAGLAGLPAGLPGMPFLPLPARIRIRTRMDT